jgi:hypothetical protein
MNIQFELFPTNTNPADYRFHLNIQPIHIIYDAVSYHFTHRNGQVIFKNFLQFFLVTITNVYTAK